MTYDVFISYPPGAQKIAEALLVWLERHGIRCFAAFRDLPDGGQWKDTIPSSIRASRLVVAVFAEGVHAAAAPVYEEVSVAIETGRPVLPFRLKALPKEESYPRDWARRNWMDAFPNPQITFAKITRQVNKFIAKQPVAAASAEQEIGENVPPRGGVARAIVIGLNGLLGLFLAAVVLFVAVHFLTGGTPLTNDVLNFFRAGSAELNFGAPPALSEKKTPKPAEKPASPAESRTPSTPAPPPPAVPQPQPVLVPPAPAPVPIVALPPEPVARPALPPLRLPGFLRASEEVSIRAGIAGTITEIRPSAGDTIARGQPLLRFDVREQTEKISAARSELERATKDVEANTRLLADAENVVRQNAKRREDTAGLSPSNQDWELAITAATQAKVALERAKVAVQETGTRLATAERNLEKIVLNAPADGLVLSRSLECEVGQAVRNPEAVLFTFAPMPVRLHLQAEIPVSALSRAVLGGTVNFTLVPETPAAASATPSPVFTGKITQVESSSEKIGKDSLRRVEIEITSPPSPLFRHNLAAVVEFPAP